MSKRTTRATGPTSSLANCRAVSRVATSLSGRLVTARHLQTAAPTDLLKRGSWLPSGRGLEHPPLAPHDLSATDSRRGGATPRQVVSGGDPFHVVDEVVQLLPQLLVTRHVVFSPSGRRRLTRCSRSTAGPCTATSVAATVARPSRARGQRSVTSVQDPGAVDAARLPERWSGRRRASRRRSRGRLPPTRPRRSCRASRRWRPRPAERRADTAARP